MNNRERLLIEQNSTFQRNLLEWTFITTNINHSENINLKCWLYLNQTVLIILEMNCKIWGNSLSNIQVCSGYFLHHHIFSSHPWTSTVQPTLIQKELTVLHQSFHFLISWDRVNTMNRGFIIYFFIISR